MNARIERFVIVPKTVRLVLSLIWMANPEPRILPSAMVGSTLGPGCQPSLVVVPVRQGLTTLAVSVRASSFAARKL